ncbi:MAG: GspE/PulE family protein [Spirochaetes bacterium]|nr:GspE/PulE family protein [Spirochaetota bacterium]
MLERLDEYEPLPVGEAQYSLDFCEENKVLKLSEAAEQVLVCAPEDIDADVLSVLEHYHGKPVRVCLVSQAVFSAARGRVFSMGLLGTAAVDSSGEGGFHLDALEGDAPVINFINGILIDAIRLQASDVHIECFSAFGQVRLRVDGSLVEAARFPVERFAALAARIKIMANLNIMEKRLPQDGRVSVDLGKDRVDLRVSIVPIARGESIVLRLLGRSSSPLSFAELGMDDGMTAAAQRMLAYPHGLVLLTGPTGSGKTTTLNAMLRRIQSTALKIITIEDPVEYVLDGLDQIQVNEQIGLGFETLLRRVLRQDPNVIMVGEVRDAATADLVIRAALTGHLVLSTLHTNDSISAVSRLRNIGVEPFLIAAVLRGVIAQRLVRRLCPQCRRLVAVKPAEQALAARHNITLTQVPQSIGCPACNQTGYNGRFALYEHFMPDEQLEEMIVQNAKYSALQEYLQLHGMKTLARAGLERVAAGETTIAELEREVEL